MAESKGIFRDRLDKIFQRAIRQRFVVPTAVVVAADVQSIVFPQRRPRVPGARIRHQPGKRIPLGVAVVPVGPPGWQEAIRARTLRYPKLLARERFDYKKAARAKYFEPPVTSLGVSVPVPKRPVQRRRKARFLARRFPQIRAGVQPSVGAHIGWLVSWIIRRVFGHNLRR